MRKLWKALKRKLYLRLKKEFYIPFDQYISRQQYHIVPIHHYQEMPKYVYEQNPEQIKYDLCCNLGRELYDYVDFETRDIYHDHPSVGEDLIQIQANIKILQES